MGWTQRLFAHIVWRGNFHLGASKHIYRARSKFKSSTVHNINKYIRFKQINQRLGSSLDLKNCKNVFGYKNEKKDQKCSINVSLITTNNILCSSSVYKHLKMTSATSQEKS